MTSLGSLKYSDLSEIQPEETKTEIEREPLFFHQREFILKGYTIVDLPVPKKVLDDYIEYRSKIGKEGWHYPTPFMDHEPLRNLALNSGITLALKRIMGQSMGLNLALTGWVSTERAWHSDSYLNPRGLWSNYVAAWFALEDIHPDSGPFQMVPGSHLWPVITKDKLFEHMTKEEQLDPGWPRFTQDHLSRICEEEIERRNARIVTYTPKYGQVLFWHSNLIHRGSIPKNPNMLRRSLICHYSGVEARRKIDMPDIIVDEKTGGTYFKLPTTGQV